MAGKWSAADIADQTGRVAVVTGANSGIGLVTARELARAGADVVLACRDERKGEAAAAEVRVHGPGSASFAALDLADLDSVRAFAERFASTHDRLDLLVNNAGVMAIPLRLTADGFEMQLGTNHLGHFALTGLLLERLLATAAARIVTVSSIVHKRGRINFEDLNGERHYDGAKAYGQAKLANLLFTFELDRRLRAAAAAPISVAAHPGYSATNLQLVGPQMQGSRLTEAAMRIANAIVAQSPEAGALPTLYAATFPGLEGGSYVGPDGPLEMRGRPKLVGASARARNTEDAARLWTVSEELTGVRYELAARR